MSNRTTVSSKNAAKATDRKAKHWLRKTAFYLIASIIPIVFFLLLEGGLRLVGYGKDVPLFIENPANPHYILPRPDVMSRYFPDNAPKPNVTLEANFLLKQKPENGLRIFVQGGSTAAGFPYGYGASLAATLDQRLKQSLPGKHVEVVGTALSAVNSYTLLDFADEIITQSPDAVLIYAGHNEFLGILGVGSTYGLANASHATLWFLKLKDWRIFQLVQQLFFASQSNIAPSDADLTGQASRTLMSKVAKQKHIELDDNIYQAGVQQFERNMRLLINKYQKAGIPVFIGTLASNQRDQKPFSSLKPEPEHQALLERVLAQTGTNNLAEGQQKSQKASDVLIHSTSADLHYMLAQTLEQQRLYTLAKTHYLLAIEHDLLRFRAPSDINEFIIKLANQSNVYLVDTLAAFEQRSPHNIIGTSLMLEHLHPNLQGYFVLSESFYQSLQKSDLFRPWQNVPIGIAWQQRLVLPSEEYFGFATIQKLLSDYPFTDTPIPLVLPAPTDWQQQAGKLWFEKHSDWLSMMQSNLQRYRNENQSQMAFKTLQILADALPHNGLYNVQIAEHLLQQKRYNEALHYYRRAQLAGAVGNKIDNNITHIEEQLATSM